jgi:integrase
MQDICPCGWWDKHQPGASSQAGRRERSRVSAEAECHFFDITEIKHRSAIDCFPEETRGCGAKKSQPCWVYLNLRGRVHYKVCEKAKLRRVRIHDLRHSYATIRISAGHSIAYVSRQLGHASIKITVDTSYHWLPSQHTGQVTELDQIGKIRNSPQPKRTRGYGLLRTL